MKIQLYNRDGLDIWLENIEDDFWELKTKDKEYFSYLRLIYEDDKNDIFAVDPPGGPFLHIGMIINGEFKIIGILNNGHIIQLEKQ